MKLIDGKKIAKKIEEKIKKSAPSPSYSPLPPPLTPRSLPLLLPLPTSPLLRARLRQGAARLRGTGGQGENRSAGGEPLGRGRKYGLAAILVGDDPASRLYVHLKEKAAKRVGIKFEKILYPISNEIAAPSEGLAMTQYKNLENKIIKKIHELNNDKTITGIIIQLPLPKFLDTNKIITAMDPKKDVDGYHPKNIAAYTNNQCIKMPPAVFSAVQEILRSVKIKTQRKTIVFVSRKNSIFPLPFEHCFAKDAKFLKITLKDAEKFLPKADIIITAVGKKHYLKSSMVKNGAVIIDIGIARAGHHVFGDADPKSLAKKRGWLTPVPGGVGPVTVACLLKNTIN